jgi:hypothetical protein
MLSFSVQLSLSDLKIETIFGSTDGPDLIAAVPAMYFDVLRDPIHLLGFSDRDIRQFEQNDEFMCLHFRNPPIVWLLFRLVELFDRPVSRAVLRQIYESASPEVMSEALKRGPVGPGHQGKGTELTLQQETETLSWIEDNSAKEEARRRTDLFQYLRDRYNPALSKEWVNYLFLRHQHALCRNASRRREPRRLQISCLFLEKTSKTSNNMCISKQLSLYFTSMEWVVQTGRIIVRKS